MELTGLTVLREAVELLASEGGSYYLVCSKTGQRPVPADGLFFESRDHARAAAQATERYRSRLREYDPRLPHRDVIVCQGADSAGSTAGRTHPVPGGRP